MQIALNASRIAVIASAFNGHLDIVGLDRDGPAEGVEDAAINRNRGDVALESLIRC